MKKIIFILFLLITTVVSAQYQITIDAYLLDRDTKEPIPYVNVQCIDKDLQAVTDTSGKFTLTFDEDSILDEDRFQFKTKGYDLITVEMSKLSKYLRVSNKIYLHPKKEISKVSTIKGNVFTEKNMSIQNASVRVKNTFTEVQTSFDGSFEIPAKIGDTLVVEYLGMSEKEVVVTDTIMMDVKLKPNAELLKTVMLKGKKQEKKKRYFDSGFGPVNLENYGIGQVLTSEDIGPQHIYTSDILRGSVAGLFVYNGGANTRPKFAISPRQSLRGMKATPIQSFSQTLMLIRGEQVQVYYDGFPFRGSVDDIEIRTIDNIVVLKSISSTILYGGVPTILITSKNRFQKRDEEGKIIDSALLTNNNYNETVPLLANNTEKPAYITALENAKTYESALKIYNTQQQSSSNKTIPYYIDTAAYFKKWNDEKAVEVLQNIETLAYNNPKALKVLAYKLEELERFEEAKLIYQRIAILLPNAAQSYRDLALIYKRSGYYQQSLDLYVKMLTDSFENVSFVGLEKTLVSEMQHLLRRHRSEVDYKNIPSNLLTTTFKYDVRVVFEWNKPEAEFELQFVSPENKEYTWKHSVAENKDRLFDEVKNGYHTEEFIIDEALTTGEWMINVKNLKEEKAFNPAYLKYTIYKNYGTPNEERSIKVVKLYKQLQKVTLDKITYQLDQ
ncbi:carboxypeptidase-like regulatory domain-containing protein [Kordia algicida OT-1]|uniref:TonB-dependent receptor plug domain-containing protein n=1 Tax=Kordia algicida OT-1 TaxID=391587 RepID=A9DNU7_9FLAO|nr:carboxypeptidase-like regulatory domain-containing protein [Kordia algicida]EDP97282.1 hypothetical protein KAOT1_19007 [Kordia algicida OT-1]